MPITVCPICSGEPIPSSVLELVCRDHSDGLALFKNDPDTLMRAAVYAERNNKVQEMLKGKI